MKICDKNIIECLRDRGVNPVATARETGLNLQSVKCPASNAIDYSTTTNYESGTSGEQWWMVDFGQIVNIDAYQIFTGNVCDYIYKWNATASFDNSKWTIVDEPAEGHPNNANYTLKKNVNLRYFKINNVSPNKCKYKMVFTYIKFYGSLGPLQILTYMQKHEISHNIMILISLICS